MKRYIHSTEMPDGFLKTSRFTAPSINTSDKRNALEALEIAIAQKYDQFKAMLDRQFEFTSNEMWSGVITEFEEGYYISLGATRANFFAFVPRDNHVIHKPRKLSRPLNEFAVQGEGGTVYKMT